MVMTEELISQVLNGSGVGVGLLLLHKVEGVKQMLKTVQKEQKDLEQRVLIIEGKTKYVQTYPAYH